MTWLYGLAAAAGAVMLVLEVRRRSIDRLRWSLFWGGGALAFLVLALR